MRCANPQALWLLLPVAVALLLQLRAERRRAAALTRFARGETLPFLVPPRDRRQELVRGGLRYAALLLAVAALLRPQGELQSTVGTSEGVDILVALDTSRSMLAADPGPSRLAVARGAVERLAASLRGDRIGLLLFSGSSFLACPLTTDYDAFREVLRETDTESIPRGGTSLAAALEGGIKGFKGVGGNSRVLIVVTDGEEHEGEMSPPLQELRAAGISLVAAGVGSPGGALIPLPGGYLKDRQGNVVRSALDAATLRRMAEGTGGVVITIDGADALSRLYTERLSLLPKREVSTGATRRYREWFQVPLGAAGLLLFLELLLVRGTRRP